jgi:hypothetical protein
LAELKEDYAEMIVKSYKSSAESRAMFLLSSENFCRPIRAQYMKQWVSKMQGEEIKVKSDKLADFNQS